MVGQHGSGRRRSVAGLSLWRSSSQAPSAMWTVRRMAILVAAVAAAATTTTAVPIPTSLSNYPIQRALLTTASLMLWASSSGYPVVSASALASSDEASSSNSNSNNAIVVVDATGQQQPLLQQQNEPKGAAASASTAPNATTAAKEEEESTSMLATPSTNDEGRESLLQQQGQQAKATDGETAKQQQQQQAPPLPVTKGDDAPPVDDFWKPRVDDQFEIDEEEEESGSGSDDDDEADGEEQEFDAGEEGEDDFDDDESLEGDEFDDDELDDDENYDIEGYELHPPKTAPVRRTFDDLGDDLGEPQEVTQASVVETIQKARTYMETVVNIDPSYEPVRDICKNKHKECAFWASIGECLLNPRYMQRDCAPVCQSCDQVHAAVRCKVEPNDSATDALRPGDLNRMFERIVADPAFQQFEPKVLSRPEYALGDTPETASYQLGMWLVQFDNFSTPEECDALVTHGARVGYNRSADVGEEKPDGTFTDFVNNGRTSTNAWCDPTCHNDTLPMAVMKRMEYVTGIPESYQEHLQLLRYEPGQYYHTHNDYIPHQRLRKIGPRILTFFLYLNGDDGLEGGETDFPRLGLSVVPRKGRAVLWPSVFDHDPNHNDQRSDHQALPVKAGIKYGANAWIHLRDVKNDQLDCL